LARTLDLEKVLLAYKMDLEDHPHKDIATSLQVNERTVRRWVARMRKKSLGVSEAKTKAIERVRHALAEFWGVYHSLPNDQKAPMARNINMAMARLHQLLGLTGREGMMEIALFAGPQGAGVRITNVPIDEQIEERVKMYESNPDAAATKGLPTRIP